MPQQYCYTHPMLGSRTFGPFDSRDAAAKDCLTRNPYITGGGTCPILIVRDGVMVPEHNSFVGWNLRSGGIEHNQVALRRARVR